MSEILIASLVFALAICGLAVGFILNNKPLQGSCGGLSTFEEGAPCEFCGKEPVSYTHLRAHETS